MQPSLLQAFGQLGAGEGGISCLPPTFTLAVFGAAHQPKLTETRFHLTFAFYAARNDLASQRNVVSI